MMENAPEEKRSVLGLKKKLGELLKQKEEKIIVIKD